MRRAKQTQPKLSRRFNILAVLILFFMVAGLQVGCGAPPEESGLETVTQKLLPPPICAGNLCGNKCVSDFSSNREHCGSCNKTCGSQQICKSGACKTCSGSKTRCGNKCKDLRTNRSNCGTCGNKCGSSEICSNSSCQACPAGQTRCGNKCIDLQSDSNNCSSCNNKCSDGLTCGNGICQDLSEDRNNCGAIGNQCSDSQICKDGSCQGCGGGFYLKKRCDNRCINGWEQCNPPPVPTCQENQKLCQGFNGGSPYCTHESNCCTGTYSCNGSCISIYADCN